MESLGEALPKEQARVRELIIRYRDPELNGAGNFAAVMMEQDLKETDAVVMNGDIAGMMRMYEQLKTWRE